MDLSSSSVKIFFFSQISVTQLTYNHCFTHILDNFRTDVLGFTSILGKTNLTSITIFSELLFNQFLSWIAQFVNDGINPAVKLD